MIANVLNTVVSKVGLALISILLLLLNSNYLGVEGLGIVALIVLKIAIYLLVSNLVTGGSLVYFASKINTAELFIISYVWMFATAALFYFIIVEISNL